MDLFSQGSRSLSGDEAEKILTVSQFTRKVRNLLEGGLGALWVQGEMSNLRRQTSGHVYFTLKDAAAQLSCVLFRSNAQFIGVELRDGMQVQAFGDVTVYEARGQYQMIVRKLQESGQGALQLRFEALKAKLAAEGLFASSRKKPLPKFPQTIAIVTSPTGAAIRDIIHVLARRAPWVRLLVYPVRVQGIGAETETATALRALSQPNLNLGRIDLIIIGRGGGSLEDLWCFNEEVVARAMVDCPIPIISAVGHEIDFTIADFVADMRAPTPSAAAEIAVPDRAELAARLSAWWQAMENRVRRTIEESRRVLEFVARSALMREPARIIGDLQQRLDSLETELRQHPSERLHAERAGLAEWRHRLLLCSPERNLERRTADLLALREKFFSLAGRTMESRRVAVERTAAKLQLLGPESVLGRGFSYTTDASGRPITSLDQVEKGQLVTTKLMAGEIKSRVESMSPPGD